MLLLQAGEPLLGGVTLPNQAGPLPTELFHLLAQRPALLFEQPLGRCQLFLGRVAIPNQTGTFFTDLFDLPAKRPALLFELLQAGELLPGGVTLLNQAGPLFTDLFDLPAKRPALLFDLLSGCGQLFLRRVALLANGRGLLLDLGDLGSQFLGQFLQAGRFSPGFFEHLFGSGAAGSALGQFVAGLR
jgi:hypothetical protein